MLGLLHRYQYDSKRKKSYITCKSREMIRENIFTLVYLLVRKKELFIFYSGIHYNTIINPDILTLPLIWPSNRIYTIFYTLVYEKYYSFHNIISYNKIYIVKYSLYKR